MIRVLVWNEFLHEKRDERVKSIYPDGIHGEIAKFLSTNEDIEVKTATLDDENCGITKEVLDNTDVLLWWGHMGHNLVPDEVAALVRDAVHDGMGMIFLHSAHHSKPFKLLMGTTCNLGWRESDDKERLWILDHNHPIMAGLENERFIELEGEETYTEPFGIPDPDKLLMIGWYNGGEVFRSACCWRRENGKIFYFQPGHETYPTYHNANVQKIITNAVRWVHPICRIKLECPWVARLEEK
jgi:trehalose utilization protein